MSCKQVIRALKKLGFYEVNGKGDHRKLTNDKGKVTVIPYRGSRQLAHGTISAICRQTGISKQVLIEYS